MYEFLRFAGVGIFGFFVDISSFYILINLLSFQIFDARFTAFAIAIFVTWLGNRLITFKNANKENISKQLFKYVIVSCSAGAVNLFIFNALIIWGIITEISFVIGVLSGMLVNYFGIKTGVFKAPV